MPEQETDHYQVLPVEDLIARWRVGSHEWSWDQEYVDLWLGEPSHSGRIHELFESISAEGIREPVLLGNDGRVWDGHHRVVIAMVLGLPVPVEYAADQEVRP